MSERGRDVVRYVKAVERGPEYQAVRALHNGDLVGWEDVVQMNADWARAERLDWSDPTENALAALRALQPTGP